MNPQREPDSLAKLKLFSERPHLKTVRWPALVCTWPLIPFPYHVHVTHTLYKAMHIKV